MDIPKGATSLILPDNKKIVLFAVTAAKEDNKQVTAASELFRSAIRPQEAAKEVVKENLMKNAKVIGSSGFINERETPEMMLDGDPETKWCDIAGIPSYVDFDLGATQSISGWKVVSAGNEDRSFITATCFLQGKNSPNEDWKTLSVLEGNHKNEAVSLLTTPGSARYLRLLVTQPTQKTGYPNTRICEFEVYK